MSMTQLDGRQIRALGGDVSGQGDSVSVDKIKGTPVSAVAPTPGQVLTFDGTQWYAATGGGGGGPATQLATTGLPVTVTSAPPTAGQVLTATSATTADWETPTGGGGGGPNPYAGTGSFVKTNTYRMSTPPDINGNRNPEYGTALAYDGTYLWSITSTNFLVKSNLSGVEVARYPSPVANPSAVLIFSGGFLWAANNSTLFKVSTTTGLVVASYAPQSTTLRAVVSDGTYIYCAGNDGQHTRVFKFNPATERFSNLFEQASAFSTDAIETDGTSIWIADRTSAIIHRVTNGPIYATNGFFNVTFVAVNPGVVGNGITVTVVQDAPAVGAETISVSGSNITFHVVQNQTGDQVFADLVAGSAPAAALVNVEINGSQAHNYAGITNQPLAGGMDYIQGTTDVSASGLPVNMMVGFSALWVTMNNGDLLRVDLATGVVLGTYPSGASALGGLCTDGSYFIYVVETAPSNKVRAFDATNFYFVDLLSPGNTPDDVVWDIGNNLWSIDRTSPLIKRIDRKTGALLGTTDITTYGLPRRGVFGGGFLRVATSLGFVVNIDPTTDTVVAARKPGSWLNAMASTGLSGGADAVVATATLQDVVYTAPAGFGGNRTTVQYSVGATAGAEVVTVGPEQIGTMTEGGATGLGPVGIAFDGTNFWTVNGNDSTVTKVTPAGVSTTYSSPNSPNLQAIAFDGTNMWTANGSSNTVCKISPAGVFTTYYGIPSPYAIAFDGTNMWTGNGDGSVSKITPAGVATTYPGAAGSITGIAFDGTNMWVTKNAASGSVTKVSPTGVMTVYTGTGSGWSLIAFDGTNMWITIQGTSSVVKVSPAGAFTYYPGLGVNPFGIAFDGTNMWVANNGDGSVSRVTPAGVVTTYPGTATSSQYMVFDGANFMWLAAQGVNQVKRVNVTGAGPSDAVYVQIADGVSTAQQIVTAVSASAPASALVTPTTSNPTGIESAAPFLAPTALTGGSDPVSALITNPLAPPTKISYTAVTPGAAGNSITIAYTAGGTAGSEAVTVIGNAISVSIADGVSKARDVVNAVNAFPAAAALVTAFTDNRVPSALTGISYYAAPHCYVSDPTTKTVWWFDVDSGPTDSQIDLDSPSLNTPDDLTWDTGGSLWIMDLTKTVIQRISNTSPTVIYSNVSVAADGGTPRRLGQGLNFGLWVTMSSGNLLLCDPNGAGNIQRTIATGSTDLSGITSDYGAHFHLSAAGATNKIVRFAYDGGAIFDHIIQTQTLPDLADAIAFKDIWFFTIKSGTGMIRKVSMASGNTIDSLDISAQGLTTGISAASNLVTLASGKIAAFNSGYLALVATLAAGGVTYKANTGGVGGNTESIQLTAGAGGNTAFYTAWDGLHLTLAINPGVTTAQVLADAVNNIAYYTGITATATAPSQIQAVMAQTFMTGGGDAPTSTGRVVPSEKSVLQSVSSGGSIVGFTSPTVGFMRFSPGGFYYIGSMYRSTGSVMDIGINGARLITVDVFYPFSLGRVISIPTMTPYSKPIYGVNFNAFNVASLGAYSYLSNNNYPFVQKVDLVLNKVVDNIPIGDQAGGNNYEWGLQVYSDGASIWSLAGYFPNQPLGVLMLDRIDASGRVVASMNAIENSVNGGNLMVRVADTLFVRSSNNLHKFAVNLDGGTPATGNVPIWKTYVVTAAQLAAAANSNDIELFPMPANGVMQAIEMKTDLAFVGGALTDYQISVGVGGDLARYFGPFSVHTGAGDIRLFSTLFTEGTPVSVRVAATSSGAQLNAATSGQVTIKVLEGTPS